MLGVVRSFLRVMGWGTLRRCTGVFRNFLYVVLCFPREVVVLANCHVRFVHRTVASTGRRNHCVNVASSPVSSENQVRLTRGLHAYRCPRISGICADPVREYVTATTFVCPRNCTEIIPRLHRVGFNQFRNGLLSRVGSAPRCGTFVGNKLSGPTPNNRSVEGIVRHYCRNVDFVVRSVVGGGCRSTTIIARNNVVVGVLTYFNVPGCSPGSFTYSFYSNFAIVIATRV